MPHGAVDLAGVDHAAGARHRWPKYLVTAPHRVVSAEATGSAWLPYGEWHARQVGSSQTLCGHSAVTWTYFWSLPFDPTSGKACRECAAVVAPSAAPAAAQDGAR